MVSLFQGGSTLSGEPNILRYVAFHNRDTVKQ